MYSLNSEQEHFNQYHDIDPLLINVTNEIRNLPVRIGRMLESSVLEANPQQYQYFKSCKALFDAESTFHSASNPLIIIPKVQGIDLDLYFKIDHAKTQYTLTYIKLREGSNITDTALPLWKDVHNLIDSKLGIPETININNFAQYGLPLTKELENGVDKEYPTLLAVSGTLTLNYLEYLNYKQGKGKYSYSEILNLWLTDSKTALKEKNFIKPIFLAEDVRANTGILSYRLKKFSAAAIMEKRKYLPCTLLQKLRTLEHCKFNPIVNTSYDIGNKAFVMAASPYSLLGNIVPYLKTINKTVSDINSIKKLSQLKTFLVDIESRDSIRYNYLKDFPYLVYGVALSSNYLWVTDVIGKNHKVVLPLDALNDTDLTLKAFLICHSLGLTLDSYNSLAAKLGSDFEVDPAAKNPLTKKFSKACNATNLVELDINSLPIYNTNYNRARGVFAKFNEINKGK